MEDKADSPRIEEVKADNKLAVTEDSVKTEISPPVIKTSDENVKSEVFTSHF